MPIFSSAYLNAVSQLAAGALPWADRAQTYRVLLVGSGYVPNFTADLTVSQVSDELSGPGYVRKEITDRSVVTTGAALRYVGKNVRWTSIGPCSTTAVAAVLFKVGTGDIDSPLVAYIGITPTKFKRKGTFVIRWDKQASIGKLFSLELISASVP